MTVGAMPSVTCGLPFMIAPSYEALDAPLAERKIGLGNNLAVRRRLAALR
jgi:hypothetical protein